MEPLLEENGDGVAPTDTVASLIKMSMRSRYTRTGTELMAERYFFLSRLVIWVLLGLLVVGAWVIYGVSTRTTIQASDVRIVDEKNPTCAAELYYLGLLTDDDDSTDYCRYLVDAKRIHSVGLLLAIGVTVAWVIFSIVHIDAILHVLHNITNTKTPRVVAAKIYGWTGMAGNFESVYYGRTDPTIWIVWLGLAPFLFFVTSGIVSTQNIDYLYHGAFIGVVVVFVAFAHEKANSTRLVSHYKAAWFSGGSIYKSLGSLLMFAFVCIWVIINFCTHYRDLERGIEVPSYVIYTFVFMVVLVGYWLLLRILNHFGANTRTIGGPSGHYAVILNSARWAIDLFFMYAFVIGLNHLLKNHTRAV